jgi:hypothetical protein
MSTPTRRRYQSDNSFVKRNYNGWLYQPGRMYQLSRNTEVLEAYLCLLNNRYLLRPTINEMAELSQVSWGYANQVIVKYKAKGVVRDPETIRREKNNVLGPGQKLSTIHEMFLLCLRTLDPARPLYSYMQELNNQFGLSVSHQSITEWWDKRWDFRGNLVKAIQISLDKWKPANKVCYYEFVQKLCLYKDHSKYNFIDEKHIYNKDCYPLKVRRDPLSGNCHASTSAVTSVMPTTSWRSFLQIRKRNRR